MSSATTISFWKKLIIIWASLVVFMGGGLVACYFLQADDTIAATDDAVFNAGNSKASTVYHYPLEGTIFKKSHALHRHRRLHIPTFLLVSEVAPERQRTEGKEPEYFNSQSHIVRPGYYSFLHRYSLF